MKISLFFILFFKYGCPCDLVSFTSTTSTMVCYDVTSLINLPYWPPEKDKDQQLTLIGSNESNISTIEPFVFQNYSHLYGLYLHSLRIKTIKPGAFNGLEDLQSLSLMDNELTEVVRGIFDSLTKLWNLDFSKNRIHTIESFSLIGIDRSLSLNLDKNNISNIRSDWFKVPIKLRRFSISFNPLIEFCPYGLSGLVDVRNCGLNLTQSFCKEEFNSSLENVTVVWMDHNGVKSLDKFLLNKMKNLEGIAFTSNNLSKIDKDIFWNLNKLGSIDLSDNNIKEIKPKTFKNLRKLRVLDLARNKIRHLPYGIFDGLINLEILNLSHNRLTTLPLRAFRSLLGLGVLNLQHNKLVFFEAEDMFAPDAETTLSLNYNQWDCKKFVKIYDYLMKEKLKVFDAWAEKGTNVHGIHCINY